MKEHPFYLRFANDNLISSLTSINCDNEKKSKSVIKLENQREDEKSKYETYILQERSNQVSVPTVKFEIEEPDVPGLKELTNVYKIKYRLAKSWLSYVSKKIETCNSRNHEVKLERDNSGFTEFQKKVLVNGTFNYNDMCFSGYKLNQYVEIREVYCLHILNHLFSNRDYEIENDQKLKATKKRKRIAFINNAVEKNKLEKVEDLVIKDKGFTRPKILLLFPTRICCLKFMKLFFELLPIKAKVSNKERFFSEFCNPVDGGSLSSESYDELDFVNNCHPLQKQDRKRYENAKPRSINYLNTFETNISDLSAEDQNEEEFKADFEAFKFGIRLREKKNIDLFTDFFKSDIIVSTPLDLKVGANIKSTESFLPNFETEVATEIEPRLIEGEEDEYGLDKLEAEEGEENEMEKSDQHDFLSSIEICVVFEAEKLLMQNYQHFIDILNVINRKPSTMRTDFDFSRIRTYFLEGRSYSNRFLQLCIFSSITHPYLKSILRVKKSISGSVTIRRRTQQGCLAELAIKPVKITLRRSNDLLTILKEKMLKRIVKTVSHIEGLLIIVPSYFNFIKFRNIFEEVAKEMNLEYDSRTLKEKKADRQKMKASKGYFVDKPEVDVGLFGCLNEFSALQKITKLRADFLKKKFRILMVSERFHFYYRYFFSGVLDVCFLGLPLIPQHANDFISMSTSKNITIHYTKAEAFQLQAIIGSTADTVLKSASNKFIVNLE